MKHSAVHSFALSLALCPALLGPWHATASNRVVAWGDIRYDVTLSSAQSPGASQIASGSFHSLVIRSDRSLAAWGDDRFGQCDVPSNLKRTPVLAVAAGNVHSLALLWNGTVAAWGPTNGEYGDFGQTTVPPQLKKKVVEIAAGALHSLALKRDGTVVAWGGNWAGQCDVPAGLDHVVAIAGGTAHSIALKKDGTVVAWGANEHGESAVPAGLGKVVAIAAAGFHSLALK
ncbi:MAG: RCC1 domain-containing protein, partial [Verrucomicrobiota bacterium]